MEGLECVGGADSVTSILGAPFGYPGSEWALEDPNSASLQPGIRESAAAQKLATTLSTALSTIGYPPSAAIATRFTPAALAASMTATSR